jgi:hypothetical protein
MRSQVAVFHTRWPVVAAVAFTAAVVAAVASTAAVVASAAAEDTAVVVDTGKI